jgi:RHS repeat-associated protein
MSHYQGRDLAQPGIVAWNRRYQYARDSNRLLATSLPGDPDNLPAYTDAPGYRTIYRYDAHGNMTAMPHLSTMQWDFKDQLQATAQQVVNDGAPVTTWYVYDAAGQRVRKVTENQNGARRQERIYLGGFEVYREHSNDHVTLERETLHVMDDKQRIALIEIKTIDTQSPISNPPSLVRYQCNNHLGSASLELDGDGQIISYEEYYPYGSTAYQAGRSTTEVSQKRYRYTGKERDEETGLYYHGARYYAPWLGRWVRCDPIGIKDGLNIYIYVQSNPIGFHDPTGTANVPANDTDRAIMLMKDAQLHSLLKSMSPEDRATVRASATGGFQQRVQATLDTYKLEAIRTGVTTVEHIRPKPQPIMTIEPYNAPLENVVHMEAWTPRPVVRETWEKSIDTAANSANPWYVRGGGFLGVTAGFLPTAGEQIIHGLIAMPQLAVTETVAAGEHAARASLLYERGADSAAADEVLASAQAGAEGVENTAGTVAMVGSSVRPRANVGNRAESGVFDVVNNGGTPAQFFGRETGPRFAVGRNLMEGIEYKGRRIIVSEGEAFYQSSAGTSGKQAGAWYKFYGIQTETGWVGKQLPNDLSLYQNPALKGTEVLGPTQNLTGPEVNQWLKSRGVRPYYE